MEIPIPILTTICIIIFTFISTLLWRTLDANSENRKETNGIIEKNTTALNNLNVVVTELKTKAIDKELFCGSVHSAVNARLKGHDDTLKEHTKQINELQIKVK